jgi:hypothetical protein
LDFFKRWTPKTVNIHSDLSKNQQKEGRMAFPPDPL